MGSFAVIALKLVGIWGWLKQAAVGAFRWALAHPWQAVAILAVAGLFWQQHRVERRDETIAARDATITDMTAKAKAARASSVTIAKESDKAHETRVADNRTATGKFIASNRVRSKACVSAPTEDQGAGPSQEPAPLPFVAMSEPDVKTCGDLQSYAESAYEWAQKLKAAGLAD